MAKHTAPAATRPERPVTHRVKPMPSRRNTEPSLATLRPDTPARNAAGNERTETGVRRPPLVLVAVLLGLASILLAVGSLGLRRGAALTTIATRMRSKGLSSGAKARTGAHEEAPPAIRYRE